MRTQKWKRKSTAEKGGDGERRGKALGNVGYLSRLKKSVLGKTLRQFSVLGGEKKENKQEKR